MEYCFLVPDEPPGLDMIRNKGKVLSLRERGGAAWLRCAGGEGKVHLPFSVLTECALYIDEELGRGNCSSIPEPPSLACVMEVVTDVSLVREKHISLE